MSVSFLLPTLPFKESVTNALGMAGNLLSPLPSPVPASIVYLQSGVQSSGEDPLHLRPSTLEPVKMQIPRSRLRPSEPNKWASLGWGLGI